MNKITLKIFFNLMIGIIILISTSSVLIFNITSIEVKEKEKYLQEQIIGSLNSINRINGLINEMRKNDLLIFSKINLEVAEKRRRGINEQLEKELNIYGGLDANEADIKAFGQLKITIKKYNDTLTFDMVDYEDSTLLILNVLSLTDELTAINNGYVSDYMMGMEKNLNDNIKYISIFSW
ncbi:hypothetical protein [Aliivibrio salmonicida]|uniref:hypothetical protein n=1 Tax=Aliivibrio salmonicida TaxID=40269 RepID=UPI0005C8B6E9|nr:hypothetical protein [Aliivibrio salmonicida]